MNFTSALNNNNPGTKTVSNRMSHNGNGNGLDPSAMTGTSLPRQHQYHHPAQHHRQAQHQVHQQRPQQSNGTPSEQQSGLIYDLSSFDPLQAHALQLSASAGLTNMLTPHAHPGSAAQHSAIGQSRPHINTQPLHQQPQHQQQQQQIQQPPPQQPPSLSLQQPQQSQQQQPQHPGYYYMHPQSSAALQPIAPATQQQQQQLVAPAGMVSQTPIVGQTPQNFILPTTAQGAALPSNYPPQRFTPGGPPGMFPNLLMTQHFQSVVANAATLQASPQQTQTTLVPASKKREVGDNSATPQPPTKKKRELAPSVVSSSSTFTDSSGGPRLGNSFQFAALNNNKSQELDLFDPNADLSSMTPAERRKFEAFDPNADLSKMTPAERRRYERNLREQQRSYRISQQIKGLREVLTESNVPFKPNKYSILSSVVEYIKQLQARAIMLDAEHQKLITTIRVTNERVNSGVTPASEYETEATTFLTANPSGPDSGKYNEMLFVQGLDYRSLFEQCPAALGIAALDGRILECNPEFQILLGFPREEILKQSLFNLVRNHQDIFRAMAEMLKFAEEPGNVNANGATPTTPPTKNQYWSGPVVSKRDTKLSMNLTLTVGDDGAPKFFSCALTDA